MVIAKGSDKQLVYYWFEQRGESIANEFAVKWHLFRDALVEGRSDGALVRLISPIYAGDDLGEVETNLTDLYRIVRAELPKYIPG